MLTDAERSAPAKLDLPERTLRFEARKVAVEVLVRVHLESIKGARQLTMGHLRLMFTLSLGALAGVLTLYASALRIGGPSVLPIGWLQAGLSILAIGLLTGSALRSAIAHQRAAKELSRFLRDPFPDADQTLARMLQPCGLDESGVLAAVVEILERRILQEPVPSLPTGSVTVLLVLGLVVTALSFAL